MTQKSATSGQYTARDDMYSKKKEKTVEKNKISQYELKYKEKHGTALTQKSTLCKCTL